MTNDYLHAQTVFKTLKMNNLGQYHDFYLKSDVLLLADVFEAFRTKIHASHKLEPVNYITLPSYSWDAMLYKTKTNLQLLDDYEMHCMIEKGIRGGISVISQRYAKANNKYMTNYDENDIDSYIMYLDANNLYGLAMSQYLPINGFKWVENATGFNVATMNADINVGYILEVDLEYPKELHDSHSDYPLSPENIHINDKYLSQWQKDRFKTLKNKPIKVGKLCPNLMNKTGYIIHSKNLEYYLSKGLKLTKIHRVIKFNQSLWLKEYIDMNTKLRIEASKNGDKFAKDLYKLMNNSVFGKTMENIRGRLDFELVNNKKRAESITSSPLFNSFHIINEDLVSIILNKKKTYFNKPIYAGFAILELSKLHMFKFHYDFIKPKYQENATLLMTDTDSLVYHIKTKDFYNEIKQNMPLFDTSEYPKNHPCYSNENEAKLGLFKDETAGKPIREFVGLRSKMYSVLLDNNNESQKAKGIKKSYSEVV